ncbi:methylated-DNA--[protein]-cysteine S-methyltransferase [Brevundimonas goettingensis]|jgi:methylated-DNA-[protein]-cysteine S-methyltransferase|uniref:Methylated-DNA--protein-cysteine methyltransferase n=1 Tax=Brevundimonas goettingensis TaxID=2774190 RepID=A0A975GX64_9CAUL|nr:methylated-DNA--[protein]-cysteine S-methyltransferase [Brevundimonas goettingensis]QTC90205.1 methylated-DNA--[protein]-cysteine S-methyltransferase [Brevundimonas goettingensis]
MAGKRPEPLALTLDRIDTPVGTVLLIVDPQGSVRALDFAGYEDRMHRLLRRHYGDAPLTDGRAPDGVRDAVAAYFAGNHKALDGLTVKTAGTDFQRSVWAVLRDIPAGETRTYGQLARAIGKPNAVRAAGLANGQNPVAVIVPCHRVIGANGTLTGYAGGLERKKWLLDHERALRKQPF